MESYGGRDGCVPTGDSRALLAFLALAKYGYFAGRYLKSLDTWQKQRGKAIAQIQTQSGVFDDAQDCPRLTHRCLIKFVDDLTPPPAG